MRGGQNLKNDDVILERGLRMMMVDDGGGRGVKNGRKSDDVINGRPLRLLPCQAKPSYVS